MLHRKKAWGEFKVPFLSTLGPVAVVDACYVQWASEVAAQVKKGTRPAIAQEHAVYQEVLAAVWHLVRSRSPASLHGPQPPHPPSGSQAAPRIYGGAADDSEGDRRRTETGFCWGLSAAASRSWTAVGHQGRVSH